MTKKGYVRVAVRDQSPENLKDDQIERFVQNERIEPRHRFVSIAERLAQSSIYHRNLYLVELAQLGRLDDDLARVEMMFPYCEGGKLYIDEVSEEAEYNKAKRKEPVLLNAGIRYLILEQNDKLDVAIEKLAVVDALLSKQNAAKDGRTDGMAKRDPGAPTKTQ